MKYQLTLNLKFKTETQVSKNELKSLIEAKIAQLIKEQQAFDESLNLNIDILNEKVHRIRIGEFSVDEILKDLSEPKKIFEHSDKKYSVRMNSHRYFMFKENLFCVCCGIKGTKMFLEYYEADMTPHFNLYGEYKGNLILMTKDHIKARALGGEDRHSNYQTMCAVCNNLKGHTSLTLESLKKLRKLYDTNKGKIGKKKLNIILEKSIIELEKVKKQSDKEAGFNLVYTNCDINCYKKNDEIYGKFVYNLDSNPRIGCIKKGSQLVPLLEYKNKVVCKLSDNESISLDKSLVFEKK